jgi:hypothetical protein
LERGQERVVLAHAEVAFCFASTIGDFVAQNRPQSDFFDRVAHQIQRTLYVRGGSVMVKQTRSPGSGCVHSAGQRAVVDGLFVESAIQAPPDQLEDLIEIDGSAGRGGHSSGKRRVEVRMRAYQTGHQQFARRVDYLITRCRFESRSAGRDNAVVYPQISVLDAWGIERRNSRRLEQVRHVISLAPEAL